MNFLSRLFGIDITRNWTADSGLKIKFDFNKFALCSVKIGDPLERLEKFGPAQDKSAAGHGVLRYYSKGVEIGVNHGVVAHYVLVIDDYLKLGYQPFSGVCEYQGNNIAINAGTSEEDIVEYFGEPYWRNEDSDEIILFYEFKDTEVQVELSTDKKLKAVVIVSPPLLADEEQRKSYGVSKSWPPF